MSNPPNPIINSEPKPELIIKLPKIRYHTVAIFLGLLLAVSSLYQINQLNSDQRRVDDLTTQIDELEYIKTDIQRMEAEFGDRFFELRNLDVKLSEEIALGHISELDAQIQLKALAIKITQVQWDFIGEYFYKNANMTENDKNSPMYLIQEKWNWLFKLQDNVTVAEQEWNPQLGEFVYVVKNKTAAYISMEYISIGNSTDNPGILFSNFSARNLANITFFQYNWTVPTIHPDLRFGPILINFNEDLYDAHLDSLIEEQVARLKHIENLSNNLVANGIAVLLVSFLVEFTDEEKLLRGIYLALAIALGLFSMIGTRALTEFFTG